MKAWLYKWLPIICGCHCKKERSFHYKGEKFPVCARCTGELVGILLAILTCPFYRLPIHISLLLIVPLVADGLVQMFTKYESNNRRRFITGILFGYGLVMVVAVILIETAIVAYEMGIEYRMWVQRRRR